DGVVPERADRRLDRVGQHSQGEGHLVLPRAAVEESVERELQVLERLERQVEPHREPAEHQVRDSVEVTLGRQGERDDVDAHGVVLSTSRSSSSSSRSRRAAASLPAATAERQSRLARSSEAPCDSPAARPEIFRTGLVTAELTVRTAESTLWTTSTALSVMRSTLSSCPFTRSTVPPTLAITGRISFSAPLMNAETRASVPPSRTNA